MARTLVLKIAYVQLGSLVAVVFPSQYRRDEKKEELWLTA